MLEERTQVESQILKPTSMGAEGLGFRDSEQLRHILGAELLPVEEVTRERASFLSLQ